MYMDENAMTCIMNSDFPTLSLKLSSVITFFPVQQTPYCIQKFC